MVAQMAMQKKQYLLSIDFEMIHLIHLMKVLVYLSFPEELENKDFISVHLVLPSALTAYLRNEQ